MQKKITECRGMFYIPIPLKKEKKATTKNMLFTYKFFLYNIKLDLYYW